MASFDAYIFDMDGTLLDTLPDLAFLTNKALESVGFPTHDEETIRSFVGGGAAALIAKATPADADEGIREHVLQTWRQMYPVYGTAKTVPFDGIPEALDELRAMGKKLGVLTNKFDAAAQLVADTHFPGKFDQVVGESPRTPRKPDPTALLRMIDELGTTPERVVFVGDTPADVQVAHNAGAFAVVMDWGYAQKSFYEDCPGDVVFSTTEQLMEFARSH